MRDIDKISQLVHKIDDIEEAKGALLLLFQIANDHDVKINMMASGLKAIGNKVQDTDLVPSVAPGPKETN